MIITNGRCTFYVVFKGFLGKKNMCTHILSSQNFSFNYVVKTSTAYQSLPLHNPAFGSILRNNIIGAPFFSLDICGGKPPRDIEFRNFC